MSQKMKIRAFSRDNGRSVVKAILYHPMETGLRKDKATGAVIPAHFITEVKVELNGNNVLTCLWGTAVSKNPFLSFDLSDTKAGDSIKISWVDNLGKSEIGETKIS
jgi:sulfur-oxidizing protein SoxZ